MAGNGSEGYSGDGGPATNAGLLSPYGVAVDGAGDLFIADTFHYSIRRVDATTKFISTVAGTGTAGFGGDGGAATSAKLNFPTEVALDGSGNLFIVDSNNERIRRVDVLTHDITTVAGNGQTGFNGDNTAATSASLCNPYGVALDGSGNVFIADTCSSRLRRVDATTQNITTVAGDGAQDFTGDGGLAAFAALNSPQAVAIDSTGNLFIADTSNGRIRRVDKLTADITTIAGGGTGGDNGAATSAMLFTPSGLAIDGSGNLLIADNQNNRIRRVDRDTQTITTVAGNGIPGFSGNGSGANLAQMWGPWGIALDSSGNLFIADLQNFRIRGVDAISQIITTVAGNGLAGYSGDGGLATSARLGAPYAVATDSAGNLFIADNGTDGRVRRVDAITHFITSVAGNGTSGYSGDGGLATSAQLAGPTGVAVDSSGNLFIADTGNHSIRRVDAATHFITTVAGNGTPGFSGEGGLATGAQLWNPYGVAVDSSGNILIADTSNYRIRRVDALTHIITTVAGNGTYGFSGDGGPAISAELSVPNAVTTDSSGNLYIADAPNNRVRATALPPYIVVQPGTLSFSSQNLATSSAAQAVTLTNTGLVPLSIASIGITSGFTETDNCAAAINPLATCTINVNFAPTTPGAQSGTITITDNAFASPHVISTSGTGVGPVASLSGPSLTFSNQLAGTTSSAQTVTLNNTGNGSMTISNIAASGDFAATNNCNGSVAANGSCTISITFKPTVVGARNGTLTVTDDSNGVAGSTQTASLSGTGTGPAVALSGSSLGFGNQLVSAASAAQTVTVTNSGTMNLTISTASISGTNAGDFAKSTDTCSGATLAPNTTCAVSVAFTPAATGSRSASLNFTDNALDSPQAVALAGTGTAPVVSLSGSSMTFVSQLVSTTSAAQSVTVTNTGTGNLTIATSALGGTNAGDFT
ncbi:MAG: choice-of-anchor D domain-containing protein, partial [Acidobacteriota bacterium]|nr:choice-of-anchor D domain-containing protein [Acidobacteriota bacterium]